MGDGDEDEDGGWEMRDEGCVCVAFWWVLRWDGMRDGGRVKGGGMGWVKGEGRWDEMRRCGEM